MRKRTLQAAALIGAAIGITAGILFYAQHAQAQNTATTTVEVQATTTAPQLTDRQRKWITALEWCESRGIPEAVNPKDRDGTPSYGPFQFKPGTYANYAKLYGMPTTTASATNYKSEAGQRWIVEQMVLHRNEVNWRQQFPDCVRRHIGEPPVGNPQPKSTSKN